MRPRLVTPALPLSLALAVVYAASSVLAAQIEMVSRDFTRRASASPSVYHPFLLSGDGRLVVFGSSGTNVVANDTNRLVDLFVYDRTLKSNVWDTTHSRWIGLLPQLGEGSEAAELTPDGR